MDAARCHIGIGWRMKAAVATLAVAAVASAGGRTIAARALQPDAGGQDPARTVRESAEQFRRNLEAYLALREELAERLEPLEPTGDAAELAARQSSLAAAIREARRDAKRGDLIPEPVAEAIRAVVAADYRHRDPEARKGTVEDVPTDMVLSVNRIYPPDAALSTVPPLLLAKLPLLPDNLQYRFVDRHVVILDGDTQIVLDYISDVLPSP